MSRSSLAAIIGSTLPAFGASHSVSSTPAFPQQPCLRLSKMTEILQLPEAVDMHIPSRGLHGSHDSAVFGSLSALTTVPDYIALNQLRDVGPMKL